jgi:hypothetical protein
LYLCTVLQDGRMQPGRGSLAEVLPESLRAMFAVAGSPGDGRLVWIAPGGHEYDFRRCHDRSADAARMER